MSNAKHTTWAVLGQFIICGDRKIAEVSTDNAPLSEAYKTARLIAAAPELLAALETVVSSLDNGATGIFAAHEQARTVIAKAKEQS